MISSERRHRKFLQVVMGCFCCHIFKVRAHRSPISTQRGFFYGITTMHTKAHFERAVMEAVAMVLREMVEATEAMGISVQEIRSLSGGAKSPVWCQIKADVTKRRIVTMKNTEDAACLGAAFLAGTAMGIWPSVKDAARVSVTEAKVYEPQMENSRIYDEVYKEYKRLTKVMHTVFQRVDAK